VQMGCKVELQDMANKVEEILHKQVYTREEILKSAETRRPGRRSPTSRSTLASLASTPKLQ